MNEPEPPPPYELRGERILIRCWHPADAPLLEEALNSSLDHLRPWMQWVADEPEPLDVFVRRLRRQRGRFDLGEDYSFGIFTLDGSRVLGACGLHRRAGAGTLEVGYWVRADAVRQGVATDTTTLLAHAAFRGVKVRRLDVKIDPDNVPSIGVPRKLGFREDGLLRRALPSREGEPYRDSLVFSMLPEEFAASPMAAATVEAFDCRGERVEL